MEERLWTKKYLFSLLLVFGVNMGYALLNSVMAIYGSVLTSSSVVGGYMITVFTLSALFIRLFIKNEKQKVIKEINSNKRNNEIKFVYFFPNIASAIVGPVAFAIVFADEVKPTPSLSLEAGTYSLLIAVAQVKLIPKPNP